MLLEGCQKEVYKIHGGPNLLANLLEPICTEIYWKSYFTYFTFLVCNKINVKITKTAH